jgi:hypothetical protein
MHSGERTHAFSVPRTGRLLAPAVLAVCAGIIGLAALLDPSPNGYGTHTSLGLPSCAFKIATGLPCPACGLTTSVALMARLDVAKAFMAHPFGVVVFALAIYCGALSLGAIFSGEKFLRAMKMLVSPIALFAFGAAFLLSWGFTLTLSLISR